MKSQTYLKPQFDFKNHWHLFSFLFRKKKYICNLFFLNKKVSTGLELCCSQRSLLIDGCDPMSPLYCNLYGWRLLKFLKQIFFLCKVNPSKKIQADVFLQYSIIHKRYEKSILQNSHNNAHLKVTRYGFRWTQVVFASIR